MRRASGLEKRPVPFLLLLAALACTAPAALGAPAKFLGPNKCTSCHDHEKQAAWAAKDTHPKALQQLEDKNAAKYAKAIGLADPYDLKGSCVGCHATVFNGDANAGVSCETCHGAGSDYVEPHQQKGNHERSLTQGLIDTRGNLQVWAKMCVDCHIMRDAKLIASGHKSGAEFDVGTGSQKIVHWVPTYDFAKLSALGKAGGGKPAGGAAAPRPEAKPAAPAPAAAPTAPPPAKPTAAPTAPPAPAPTPKPVPPAAEPPPAAAKPGQQPSPAAAKPPQEGARPPATRAPEAPAPPVPEVKKPTSPPAPAVATTPSPTPEIGITIEASPIPTRAPAPRQNEAPPPPRAVEAPATSVAPAAPAAPAPPAPSSGKAKPAPRRPYARKTVPHVTPQPAPTATPTKRPAPQAAPVRAPH
jgi:hypothetical protein